MKRYRLLKYALVSAILLASWSCSSSASETDDGSSPTGIDPDSEQTLLDYPLISRIEAEPRVVLAGEQISLTGVEGVSGTLTFSTPEGGSITATMENGTGVVSLALDVPAGLYTGKLENDTGAVAFSSFRVAGEPGVWLGADRRYVSPGEVTILSVETLGLNEETVAAVYIQAEPEGAVIPFVPDTSGRLVPGVPVPLAHLVGQRLLLDADFLGAVQVRAEIAGLDPSSGSSSSELPVTGDATPPTFDGWSSNTIQLNACSQPSTIAGDIGGEGFINAVWVEGRLWSDSTYTTDGSFTIEAGPGMVLVQSFRVDLDSLPEPESQIISLGCGEFIELAQIGSAKVASLASSWYGKMPHSISAQAPGEFFLSRQDAQSGGGEPCRTGIVVPTVSDADGVNPNHSTLAGIALKTALNKAASRAEVQSMSDIQAYMEAMAQMYLQSGDEEEWDSMMEVLRSNVASDFVISLTAARNGQRYGVNTAALPTLPEDAQVRASGQGSGGALFDPTFSVYTELAEKFRQAAICGSVEPERAQIQLDEELAISYRVTDLSGEGAEGASVSISPPECGRLEPESGSVEGEEFETQFTYHTEEYCAEELELEAEWSGSEGTVKTRSEETIVHIMPELPELTLRAGSAPGIGNTSSLATAITLYEEYDVRDQPASLSGFTQDPKCGFLEGGQELDNQYFFVRSESVGKRAESTVVFHNYVIEQGDIKGVPINAIEMFIQLETWAIEIEDDNVIRGAWASGANHSDPNLSRSPGTLLVFDIQNSGNLPTTPMISWQLGESIDDASGYSVLVFYKVIECGADPAIGSLFSFVVDGDILLESDSELPGSPTGQVPLPEFKGDRQQIIMWVTNVLTTASIRDDDAGANLGGRGRLRFQLGVNLTQEINQP